MRSIIHIASLPRHYIVFAFFFLILVEGSIIVDAFAPPRPHHHVHQNHHYQHHRKTPQQRHCFLHLSKDDEETNYDEHEEPTALLKVLHSVASRKEFLSNVMRTTNTIATSAMVATTTCTAATAMPQIAKATYIDPKTKINLPSVGEIEEAIPSNWDDIDNPFIVSNNNFEGNTNGALFDRLDNTNDSIFYNEPRFVEHVDENAVSTLKEYISKNALGPNMDVLDLCSSWTSHISTQTKEKLNLQRVSGLGMNEEELKSNTVLTDYTLMNLNTKSSFDIDGSNQNIRLPYDDSSFDVVLCQLSIDYLIYPLEVMKEVGRVLKKGGKVVILFSNRLFIQKAVGIWTGADDIDHAFIVGSYIYYSKGGFAPNSIASKDLSKRDRKGNIVGDPVYVVTATKN